MKLKDNVEIEVEEYVYECEIDTITANGKRWKFSVYRGDGTSFEEVRMNNNDEWYSRGNRITFKPNNQFSSHGITDSSDIIELSKLVEESE